MNGESGGVAVQGTGKAGLTAPVLCVTFTAACLACIPWGAPVGRGVLMGLLGLGAVALGVARVDPAGRWSRVTVWPLVAVLGSFALSIIGCQLPGLAIERSASMPLFALTFLSAQVCLWDPRTTRALWVVLAGVALSMSADIVVQWFAGRSLFGGVPGSGFGIGGSQGNKNDMAAASLLLPGALATFDGVRLGVLWRCMLAASLVPVWALSVSRQAFGGWFLGVLTMTVRRRSLRATVVGVAAAAAIAAAIIASVPSARARAMETMRNGLGDREPLIVLGAQLAVQHPVTGIGPGLFGQYYLREARNGWTWRGQPLSMLGMPWVHCLPLEVACEYGAVGLLAFGGVTFVALRRAGRSAWSGDPRGRAVLGMMVAILLVGLVDLTLIKDWVRCEVWVCLGLAFGLGLSQESVPTPEA